MSRAATGGAYHWRAYRMDDFVPTSERGQDVLLLGCGDGGERPHLEARGLEAEKFDGAQSLTYTLYDWLLPIGSRPFRRAVIGALDTALHWLRAPAVVFRGHLPTGSG